MVYPSMVWILHHAEQMDWEDGMARRAMSWALEEIGSLGDPALVEQLQPLLNPHHKWFSYCSYKALRAITQLGGTAARDALLPLLLINPHQDQSLPYSAVQGIGTLAAQEVNCDVAIEPLLLLLAGDFNWTRVQQALVNIGATAVPFLLELIHPREDYGLQERVLEVLSDIRDRRAEAPLIRSLEWAPNGLRRFILECLASIGGTKVEALLIDALQTPDVSQRINALYGLSRLAQPQDQRLLELLERALQDQALRKYQYWIIQILGRLGHPDAYPLIAPFATAENEPNLRRVALIALGHLGDLRGLDVIIGGLQEPTQDVYVKKAAIAALGQFGDRRGVAAIAENIRQRQHHSLYEEEKLALKQCGLAAVPVLLRYLKSPDFPAQKALAIECLEQIAQDPQLGPRLGEMRQSKSESLLRRLQRISIPRSHTGMIAIAMVLVRAGNQQAIDHLLALLPKAGFAICPALALLEVNESNRRVIPPLIQQAKERWLITSSCLEIFVKFHATEAIPVLIEQLSRETWQPICGYQYHLEMDWQIRTQGGILPEKTGWRVSPIRGPILEALTQLSGQEGLSLLFEIWQNPEHPSRADAGRAMGFLGQLTYSHLVDALNHRDEVICVEAIQALGRIGLPRAVPALIHCLDDSRTSIRLAAIASLRWIGDPVSAPAVERQLSDPDPEIQDTARRALCRFASDQLDNF
ncbi:MAG: HEAT repeat domain-containing protein [Coleofasciculus sp. B1-GNL1-01]|uniref:HEAT repeat domain-containing protein n=1 Tax=Coleofasciculus sp. B1-GNL1-01 TaxID=3068484 RepID=UPI0032F8D11F